MIRDWIDALYPEFRQLEPNDRSSIMAKKKRTAPKKQSAAKQMTGTERAQQRISKLRQRLQSEEGKLAVTQKRDALKKELRELSRKGR